jgi:hypothetical protein
MREAWEDFVERYTDRAERSPWHEQKMSRHAWLRTGDYILIRAHFYPPRLGGSRRAVSP